MKLYCKPGACSLSPHIVALECDLDFTQVNVDLQKKVTEQGDDYWQINPKGQVPALQLDDGSILTEGVAIVQYLADLKPDRNLLAPTGSLTRYHTLEWLSFVSSELHKSFSPLFRSDTPEEYKNIVRAQLEKKYQAVNQALQDKQWLLGLRFTVADVYLFVVTRWAKAIKLNLSGLDALETWFSRVAERPAVQAAMKAEGLV
ncbi:glutathione transferase GstA [Pantoea sp. NPDC088449]|uniref:Glutathione S-transferase n=1 Tax=Candidatus Pantoea floridensis TaxID=1938870 RepID=A0A286BLK6_9GAMM|nr:glutathione transferase GstA [Pantoea floridensis]PIF22332.1 glutathione S-transferase [Enterobacteriaceae bacterium JKS000233]SOD35034.1 glutathione S-transferase [Pantoea floridensis]HBZ16873.1 glutathione transferase GstA [Pantoea sp.]